MVKFQKSKATNQFLKNFPLILLFISVLNEFDFNYLNLKYFSFNFPFILVFYWSLKKNDSLSYGFIFVAGLFNDAVIGLPIGLDGNDTKQTKKVRDFVIAIEVVVNIQIHFQDERLSSKSATQSLIEQNIKTGHNKNLIDQRAAAIFLQQYLDCNYNNNDS